MDYGRRPYTASVGEAVNDRVSYNLNRGESLLDEPDNGFSIGANLGASNTGAFGGGGGIGSGIAGGGVARSPTLGAGSNFLGARSNYTASEMGDSDTHSNLNSVSRPRWG